MRDKKLAAVGARPRIRHRQFPWGVLSERWIKFVFKAVAWSSRSGPLWAATLYHEAVDNSMKIQTIIEVVIREDYKACNGNRCFVSEKCQVDCTFAGFNCCRYVQSCFPFLSYLWSIAT